MFNFKVGTKLSQKSDDFRVAILSCNFKRCYFRICQAFVFVGTGFHQKLDNFQVLFKLLTKDKMDLDC